MYPEFIAIYVMLAVILILLGVAVFLLIKLVKNGGASSGGRSASSYAQPSSGNAYYSGAQQYQTQADSYQAQQGGVVYCKHCTMPYDSTQPYCPNCGTRR